MRIGYSPEQEELRRELRSYFDELMTPERVEALSSTDGEMRQRKRLPRNGGTDGPRRVADAGLADGVRRSGPLRRWSS